MSDSLYRKNVRDCQAIDKPLLLRRNMTVTMYYPLQMQGHNVSIPSESQKTLTHLDLECDTRFTKYGSNTCALTYRN